jgi:predicted permease
VPEPDRILLLYNSYPNAGVERAVNGAADYYDRLKALTVFEEQAMFNYPGVSIGDAGSVERVQGMAVTPSFFRLLRARPVLGRIFTEQEGELGGEQKVILSHGLWQERFGGNLSVVGKDLRIYGRPYTIVGVMPPDFVFLNPDVRLWRPLAFTPDQKNARHSNSWEMIGRLKPGARLEQAQAQVDALNAANMERFPEFKTILTNAGFHTRVVPLQDEVVREIRRTLYLLWGAVLFVLLIGTVNIANLVLARSTARVRELAMRFALGAGRWRLTRQLLTESLILTWCSAACGLLLGYWALRAVNVLGLDRIPRGSEIAMDGSVVLFILGLALVAALVIGLVPVIHALKVDTSSVFRGEGRGSTGHGARVWRNLLATSQVAFALVLLVGAGLLLASFRQVLSINPGFAASNVLSGSVALPSSRYKGDEDQRSFMKRALERIRRLPGVMSAGATDSLPFAGDYSDSVIFAEGYVMQPGESLISPSRISVTPGYFEAMAIPLADGRFFDERDTDKATKVVIVDERLAKKFWPDTSPVGRRMWRPTSIESMAQPGRDAEWFTVVGVVGSVKLRALVDPDERVGAYYFPFEQSTSSGVTFAVRTTARPDSITASLRNAIIEIDAELPLYDVEVMQDRIDDSLVARRSPMLLSLGFGSVALLLAAIGIYGVLAYMVAQRTKEIGIRMALGSTSRQVLKLVLGEGARILAAGFVLGIAGALALGRFIETVLYGVRPMDPVVLGSVASLLLIIALIACLLPARRATRVDPARALRQE